MHGKAAFTLRQRPQSWSHALHRDAGDYHRKHSALSLAPPQAHKHYAEERVGYSGQSAIGMLANQGERPTRVVGERAAQVVRMSKSLPRNYWEIRMSRCRRLTRDRRIPRKQLQPKDFIPQYLFERSADQFHSISYNRVSGKIDRVRRAKRTP
jgi:hypothetical protein